MLQLLFQAQVNQIHNLLKVPKPNQLQGQTQIRHLLKVLKLSRRRQMGHRTTKLQQTNSNTTRRGKGKSHRADCPYLSIYICQHFV
jgi:hypothetical protein